MELYGEAISLDPSNYVYYSNRAAAFVRLHKYKESLTDANKTIQLKPDWPKVNNTVAFLCVASYACYVLITGVLKKKHSAYLPWTPTGSICNLPKRSRVGF